MDSKNTTKKTMNKTKGRQKIEIKKMSNEHNLRVTFSKRRTGIFKKASELATICGVDIVVIMFSPSNQVFSFGSPNVDPLIQRYTTQGPPPLLTLDLNEAHSTVDEGELHAQLNNLSDQMAAEKKHEEALKRLMKDVEEHSGWAMPVDSMNDAQLEKYKKMLEDLKGCVNEKREKLLLQTTFSYNSPTQFLTGGNNSFSSVDNSETIHTPLSL
ncbi:agamous-like MADS-box protein AGL62 [Vigna radiata var. radiata]|uniref:Agamous-like MADS-box protein AGL62 n=1 Tax=Vigna radiata var. radiata TaxID=3916 RepID=A0A1S3UZG7_VIGRR|nr:agamous-like MADS-box protein AGL62 [Vigna radiata var. radiata]